MGNARCPRFAPSDSICTHPCGTFFSSANWLSRLKRQEMRQSWVGATEEVWPMRQTRRFVRYRDRKDQSSVLRSQRARWDGLRRRTSMAVGDRPVMLETSSRVVVADRTESQSSCGVGVFSRRRLPSPHDGARGALRLTYMIGEGDIIARVRH